jgi:BirA family biotin operon repressor/biotin-[acetyl-CoA-carboxylase] ligase
MGGILVETVAHGRTLVAVVGCGLNLAHAPDGLDRPAAGLADHGAAPTPGEVHARLASAFDHWRAVWGEGRGADAIRKAWLARGLRPGEAMAVNTGSERVEGVFQDLGPAGELVLRDAAGRPRQFTFGDVSFATSNTDQKGTPRA